MDDTADHGDEICGWRSAAKVAGRSVAGLRKLAARGKLVVRTEGGGAVFARRDLMALPSVYTSDRGDVHAPAAGAQHVAHDEPTLPDVDAAIAPTEPAPPAPDAAALVARLADLESRLDAETAARKVIEEHLAHARTEIAVMSISLGSLIASSFAWDAAAQRASAIEQRIAARRPLRRW